MKKLIVLFSALLCVVALSWSILLRYQFTTQINWNDELTDSFFFAEDSALYSEGEPGVKTSGFVNTTKTKITPENLIDHAKKECSVWHNCIDVDVDTSAQVWRVNFSTQGMAGGGQTVYMDYDGRTLLIVYGE